MTVRYITPPLNDEQVKELRIGDQVFISGTIYTARDAAHKRLVELLDAGKKLPVDLKGQLIYYVGPSPAKPGKVIGSAGPTTSYRMDPYAPRLMREAQLKGMIGKGSRNEEVLQAIQETKGIYLAAVGGAAALIAKSIKDAEVIAYEELGPEAIRKLEVENFPTIVVNDCHGGNLYTEGKKKYIK